MKKKKKNSYRKPEIEYLADGLKVRLNADTSFSLYYRLRLGAYAFGSVGLSVCYQYYLKTYKWNSIKFSGKIKDGTSNKPLNCGSDPDHG